MSDIPELTLVAETGTEAATRFIPSRRQWVVMVVALLFLAASMGYLAGSRRGGPPAADSVDVGFLQDMISHHEQAIQMSTRELTHGAEPDVQVFAREIVQQQSYEIGVMDLQLERWGFSRQNRPDTAMRWMGPAVAVEAMPGLASDAEMELLATRAGRDADALFIALMQDHHRGGVHMATYAQNHASTAFVRELARRMATAQRLEIGEMTRARQRAELAERPDGYVPAKVPPADVGSGDHGKHN